MHDVSHSGDLPSTGFITAHGGLVVMPLDYLDTASSHRTVSIVRIDYGGGNASNIDTCGQKQEVCSVVLDDEAPYLGNYKGDVDIRKTPSEPDDPF